MKESKEYEENKESLLKFKEEIKSWSLRKLRKNITRNLLNTVLSNTHNIDVQSGILDVLKEQNRRLESRIVKLEKFYKIV